MTELPLPCEPLLLLPFILAWRATPPDIDLPKRCAIASETMKRWGWAMDPNQVRCSYKALSMVLQLDSAFDPPTAPLVAPDTECAVCGHAEHRKPPSQPSRMRRR